MNFKYLNLESLPPPNPDKTQKAARQGAVGLLPHQAVNGIQSGTVWRLVQYGQNSFHSAATAEQNKECYEKQFAHVGVQTYIKKTVFRLFGRKKQRKCLEKIKEVYFYFVKIQSFTKK